MRITGCDDKPQDIERIRLYAMRMIDYAVEYKLYSQADKLVEGSKE